MFQLKVPNSPTALRLAAEYLGKLAESSQVIREEATPIQPIMIEEVGRIPGEVCETRAPFTQAAPTAETVTGAASSTEIPNSEPAHASIPQQFAPTATEPAAQVSETHTLAASVPAPDAPLPSTTELRDTALLTDSGFTRDQMIAAGWTEESLLQHGYIEAVEVPLVVPAAPGASAPSAPPVVPAPPAPATTGACELDVNGLPWDARIHAGTKRKNADGSWTARRGVDDATVASVTAELRGVPVAATPAPVPVVAPAPAAFGELPATSAEFMQWLSAHIKAGRLSNTDATLAVQGAGLTILPDLMKPENAALIPVVAAKLKADKGL